MKEIRSRVAATVLAFSPGGRRFVAPRRALNRPRPRTAVPVRNPRRPSAAAEQPPLHRFRAHREAARRQCGGVSHGYLRSSCAATTRSILSIQLASLVIALIIVHAVYVTVVRPKADVFLAEQTALMDADPEYIQQRSVWVIIRDFEQEACFVLMLWAMAIMASKGLTTARESQLLLSDLVPISDGMRILPEDSREYARQIEALPAPAQRRLLLPRTLLAALDRFGATGSIQDASDTAHSTAETESERLDSELAMVRYIAWAIPSIGFIGTVRGIGNRPRPGTPGRRRRHHRSHPQSRHCLQLDFRRAA